MLSLLSSLASFLKGEKRVSSQEFEHAVNQLLLSDTVADATSKKVITPEGSLAISAAWAFIRILSETVGTLPIHLFHKTSSGREHRTMNNGPANLTGPFIQLKIHFNLVFRHFRNL